MGQTRTFLTYDNRQVEIKGGDYGWVIDQDEEVKALIAAIESGVTQVRELFICIQAIVAEPMILVHLRGDRSDKPASCFLPEGNSDRGHTYCKRKSGY